MEAPNIYFILAGLTYSGILLVMLRSKAKRSVAQGAEDKHAKYWGDCYKLSVLTFSVLLLHMIALRFIL